MEFKLPNEVHDDLQSSRCVQINGGGSRLQPCSQAEQKQKNVACSCERWAVWHLTAREALAPTSHVREEETVDRATAAD